MLRDRLGHGRLDLGGRNTDDRSGWWFDVSAQIGLRHVISISHAALGRMGWDHAVASRIEQEPAQQSLAPGPRPDMMRPLLTETLLHSIEQCAVDQRRLWARADLALIDDLADVKAVAQDVEEGTLGEGHAPARVAVRQPADLGPDITRTKLEHQPVDAAECEIACEDQADPVGFVFDD